MASNKKYKIRRDGRIVALRSFGDVKKGDVGGFVEKESNLSHTGKCWVYDDAGVSEDARVYGDARVANHSVVRGRAKVCGSARIIESAFVSENARVCGEAVVSENARVFEEAVVHGRALITGFSRVREFASVSDGAVVEGHAKVRGRACVYGTARLSLQAVADGRVTIPFGHFRHDLIYGVCRSDGHVFAYLNTKDEAMIVAGCREFTMTQAIRHWKETRGGTALGDETMQILSYFKKRGPYK